MSVFVELFKLNGGRMLRWLLMLLMTMVIPHATDLIEQRLAANENVSFMESANSPYVINRFVDEDVFVSEDNWNATMTTIEAANEHEVTKSRDAVEAAESEVGDDAEDPYSAPFIMMSIVYTVSTLSAIITNLIVLLVYLFGFRAKTELSIFLINLAIADFLMSTVCMPFTFAQALLKKWIFGEIMCPIVLFKQVLAVSLSIYTMVAIGIDRYFAIKCPLKNRTNHKKGKIAILMVWIVSIMLASVQLYVARVRETDGPEEDGSFPSTSNASSITTTATATTSVYSLMAGASAVTKPKREIEKIIQCNEEWGSLSKRQTYTLFNFFAVYLIPVFILGYTYTCIICIIKQTTHPGNADASRDMMYNKSKNKVVKMLIVLVCVFTICWLPLHVFTLINDFTGWLNHMPNSVWYFTISHWLAMVNCTINPIIYGYSSKNFRSDVYSLILCCKCLTRREWMRQESSRTTSRLFKRFQRSSKMAYYHNNIGVGANASFLRHKDANNNTNNNNLINNNNNNNNNNNMNTNLMLTRNYSPRRLKR